MTSVSDRAVGVKWEEPDVDGGSEIIGYFVEVREAIRRVWQKAGSVDAGQREFLVTPLLEGQQYIVQVAAENRIGVGEWVELSQSVTAKNQFGEENQFNRLINKYNNALLGHIG